MHLNLASMTVLQLLIEKLIEKDVLSTDDARQLFTDAGKVLDANSEGDLDATIAYLQKLGASEWTRPHDKPSS